MFTNDYIDGLLAPCSEEAGEGENIEYDPQFLALESMLPETTTAIIEGAEAATTDWREIRDASESLLARSKHLPTAVILTASLLEVRGLLGLRDGLCLISGILDQYWETFWPQLDPDDPDLIERENALASLSPPVGAYGDSIAITQRLRDVTIVSGRQAGILTLECITDSPDAERNQADASVVLPDAELEDVTNASEASQQSLEALDAILQTLSDHTDEVIVLDLSVLHQQLTDIHRTLSAFLGEPTEEDPQEETSDDEVVTQVSDGIHSRSDIITQLDRISSWYEKNEPGSPIPLMLSQIRGMVNMRFGELMGEIYPDAVDGSRLMINRQGSDDDSDD